MITPRNILFHELIGLDVSVGSAPNSSLIGITGQVIDETRNMISIRTKPGVKHVAKHGTIFRFSLDNGLVDVDGSALVMAPEKRTNMRIRK